MYFYFNQIKAALLIIDIEKTLNNLKLLNGRVCEQHMYALKV